MGYGIPASMKGAVVSAWPGGIGGIPATLANGTPVKIPVLQGVNVLTFGVVGTGKTGSYTLPAAECLLRANPRMLGVLFEIKRSFIDHFLQPGDKVITQDPGAVRPENLFRPNLIREIRQAADREAEMRQLADFLFGDLLQDTMALAWIQSARDAFIGILRVIVDLYPDQDTSNWELVNALRQMSMEEILGYLARHPRNVSVLKKDFNYDPACPTHYRPHRRAADILFFFNQVLEKFSGAFESRGRDTISDYLAGKYGRNLFFLYDLASAEISRPFMLYYLKKLKDFKMSNRKDQTPPLLLVLDEIDKMCDGGKTADFGLFQAVNLGREYGLQILLTSQSVENLYGLSPDFNPHGTMGGLAGFPMVLSFRPGDPTTISTLQTLFGSDYREHLVLPPSRYGSAERKLEREPLVTDQAFAGLDTGDCYVKIGACPPQKVHILYPVQGGDAP